MTGVEGMNEIKSFTFYNEYAELIDNLPTEDEKKDILLAIFDYVFNDIEPELNGMSKAIFKNLKRPIDISKNQSKRRINKTKEETGEKPEKEPEEEPQKNTSMMSMSNINKKDNRDKDRGMGEEKEKEEKRQIIEYLNNKLGTRYRTSSKNTQAKLNARLNEGYSLDDFIVVIDKKADEWIGTELEKHLTPDTLFGTKFEKYLNQKIVDKPVGKEKNVKSFQKYSQREYDNLDEFYDDL